MITIPEGGDRTTTNSADAEPVAPMPLPVELVDGILRFTLPPLAWARVRVQLAS